MCFHFSQNSSSHNSPPSTPLHHPPAPPRPLLQLSKARADGFMVIKADAFAKAAVSHIGRTSGGAVVTPYWTHAVQALLVESLPEWVAAKVFVGHHTAIMKKAYKKYKDGAKFEF